MKLRTEIPDSNVFKIKLELRVRELFPRKNDKDKSVSKWYGEVHAV